MDVCPTDTIGIEADGVEIDLGRCLFCGECEKACPEKAIHYTQDYILSTGTRDALIMKNERFEVAESLKDKQEIKNYELKIKNGEISRQIFGRSLKLRQVSAGGCGACEADTNVLNTIVFDLSRFGIQFVASPRHADGLLITGTITQNMRLALEKTYIAVPSPKIVIAVGSCAISGGIYLNHPEVHNGADSILPVDLYIPGCPPHPLTILDGILRLLGRL